jgi:hypothetical protein
MAIAKLEKNAWQSYFDHLSKTVSGKQAEIEIAALDIGVQVEADWLPLQGIVYDRKGDLLEVLLEGLDHLIHKPREIYITYDMLGLASIEIVDEDGTRQIVRLRSPLLLPNPLVPDSQPKTAARPSA